MTDLMKDRNLLKCLKIKVCNKKKHRSYDLCFRYNSMKVRVGLLKLYPVNWTTSKYLAFLYHKDKRQNIKSRTMFWFFCILFAIEIDILVYKCYHIFN